MVLFSCRSGTKKDADQIVTLYDYDVEERVASLGISLENPVAPPVRVNFLPSVSSNNLLFLSGNGPLKSDGTGVFGKVGRELTIEEGYQAARLTGINQLAAIKAHLGDLNKVVRVVKVLGMVNCDSSFSQHPQVINGFSDLMVEVFGDRGKHARAAVGMQSLPWNIAVEIELVIEIQE